MTATYDMPTDYAAAEAARLTEEENSTLVRCESVIEQGKQAFLDVGNALFEIQEQRLYRADYATWNDYLRERWNIGRSHAGRLIAASALVAEMSPIGVVVENENQARLLGQMDADVRQEAIEAAKSRNDDSSAPITARDVLTVADELHPQSAAPVEPEPIEVPDWFPESLAGHSTLKLSTLQDNIADIKFTLNRKAQQPGANAQVYQGQIDGLELALARIDAEWQRRKSLAPVRDIEERADLHAQGIDPDTMEPFAPPEDTGEADAEVAAIETPLVAFAPTEEPADDADAEGTPPVSAGAVSAPVEPVSSAPVDTEEVAPCTFDLLCKADSLALLLRGEISRPVFYGKLWAVLEAKPHYAVESADCVRVYTVDDYIREGLGPILTWEEWLPKVKRGERSREDWTGVRVRVFPLSDKRGEPVFYVLTMERKLFVRREYTASELADFAKLELQRARRAQTEEWQDAAQEPMTTPPTVEESLTLRVEDIEASMAQEDNEADIAWHQALEDVVLNMGGHVPEPDDTVPLRTFWAQALGGWLEITAELNGLNNRLNAVREAAAKFTSTTAPSNYTALKKALERYDHYVAHEMQTPPAYTEGALTLSTTQQRLLVALTEKRNGILRGQREHSAHSGGRLPQREEVTPIGLLTEILEQKAAQANIELEGV